MRKRNLQIGVCYSFGGELVMIKLKMSIEDISEYQTGILPKNAVKIETPQSIEEMMKKRHLLQRYYVF